MLSVFPAPAGINRIRNSVFIDNTGVPRASGDKPATPVNQTNGAGCSPRQRG